MQQLLAIIIFIAAALIGYKIIKHVPSLLHTPLMSGMNALSGITILGALTATAAAAETGNSLLGCLAIILAMLNIAGGFAVTQKMLRMFKNNKGNQ